MRARSPALLAAALIVVAASVFPARSRAAPLAGAALPRVSFVAPPGGSILVHGTYPRFHSRCKRPVQPVLHARFAGTIEVGKAQDGSLFIIGALPFEDYLKGIAEVPRTWPVEALKAQVVAARSYALAHVRYGDPTGRALGYQLCATNACQVYLGLGVANGPYGDRWVQAVDATAGQVLLYQGLPADTLYFSTSNGHTVSNSQVFGTSPLPYLRPVAERDDGASPTSHWLVRIPFADVAVFLRAAGAWGRPAVTGVRQSRANVVVSGPGASRTLSLESFRNDMNFWSHCEEPDRYPPANSLNGASLPQTVPSTWVRVTSAGGAAVLSGRGWGHGVGMVQWGAEGKAARGLSYSDILSYYYGGLRPQPYAEPPDIRVGIASGLSSVTIAGAGVTVSRASAGPGPWVVMGGASLAVGRGVAPPTYIAAGELTAPGRAAAGRTFRAVLSLPQLSVAQLVLRGSSGDGDITVSPSTTYQAGSTTIQARVPPGTTGGTYTIEAVVTNGIDIVRTTPRQMGVAGPAATSAPPSVEPSTPVPSTTRAAPTRTSSGSGWGVVLTVLAVIAALLLAAAVGVRYLRRVRP